MSHETGGSETPFSSCHPMSSCHPVNQERIRHRCINAFRARIHSCRLASRNTLLDESTAIALPLVIADLMICISRRACLEQKNVLLQRSFYSRYIQLALATHLSVRCSHSSVVCERRGRKRPGFFCGIRSGGPKTPGTISSSGGVLGTAMGPKKCL